MIEKEKNLVRQAKSLATQECCNFYKGYCIETDRTCSLINSRYDSIADGCIDCDWFLLAVLPQDAKLERELKMRLYGIDGVDAKTCERCGKPYIPSSNRQRYCEHCRKAGAKSNGRERTARWREKKQQDNACM